MAAQIVPSGFAARGSMERELHPLSSSDILPLVFLELPPEQILSVAALVCRNWCRASRLDSLWKGLLARATGLPEGAEPVVLPPRRSAVASSRRVPASAGAADGVERLSLSSNNRQDRERAGSISWYRFALENRLARVLLGLSDCRSAQTPAHSFPRLTRQRDPLLWSLFPGRLLFSGCFEQWEVGVLVEADFDTSAAVAQSLTGTAALNQPLPGATAPEVSFYRGDLLITRFREDGRSFEGFIIYPAGNRRDVPPSITRIDGEIFSGTPGLDASAPFGPRGRVRIREIEVVRNVGPSTIVIPNNGFVYYDSHPRSALGPSAPATGLNVATHVGGGADGASQGSDEGLPFSPPAREAWDQEIEFMVDLAPIYTTPSSIPLFLPFGERFGVGWDLDWAGQRDVGRTEFVLAL
ncbi:hypothetical protein DFJ74DRAFT_690702 [Hyaloraphidium curvatum]|nr:hypothetical protein DFJ74DRAFT_690702 [Hyaloraphidium curvatum]